MTLAVKNASLLSSWLTELETRFAKIEPQIHAFLPEPIRFERIGRDVEKLQTGRTQENLPLFGLTLGVKDIFQVDGFPTRAGSRLPEKALRGKEATSVTQLKEAGVLILGKTVTTEFAYFTPGLTRNPLNTEHTPGGSSSGSAAAVAAGLANLALGTQTIGSIIRPASFCGVVGFKPTYGRVSAEGIIPLSPSLDHVGLFARAVENIQRGAAILCQDWKPEPNGKSKPYLALQSGDYFDHGSPEMQAHLVKVREKLRQAGYWITEIDAMPEFEKIVQRHNTILAAEAAEVHAGWYESYGYLYSEKMAALIEKGKTISYGELEKALDEARSFALNLSALMDIHGIDLWISPGAVGAAPKGLASTGDPVMNLPWTQAGFPTLGLPSGTNREGLPLGLQVSADNGRDEALLAWGAEIERVLAGTR